MQLAGHHHYLTVVLLSSLILICAGCATPGGPRRVLLAPADSGEPIDAETMRQVYLEAKTPYKYGVVLEGEKDDWVDCPSVYRHGDKWFMTYIVFDGVGYESALAQSGDLLHWTPLGKIMSFDEGGWDRAQKAGYIALQDTQWGGSYELERYKREYWMSYFGGALEKYESDPLAIGIAHSRKLGEAVEWERLPEPVLSRDQPDVRGWENLTQYKSNIIRDPEKSLGWPFVMFYNAKPPRGHERIGMAVSKNMTEWLRYGADPVIDAGGGISGDPQVVRMGDLWVMFYFGAFWRPGAFDTFACSRDLVHWTKWTGPDLISPGECWDRTFAHKPWLVKWDGVVYHFYCAVGDRGRVIAVATSKKMR